MADVSFASPAMVSQTGTYVLATPRVDLDGAQTTGFRTFADAVTAGTLASLEMVHVRIEDASGNWSEWVATFTDAATDTVTQIAEIDSDGTAIADSATVTVEVVPGSAHIQSSQISSKKDIIGAQIIITDHDTVQLGPGSCMVDGEWLEWTSNISSGNLGQAAAGLSSTGRWNWYLYNNSGTPALELSKTVSVKSTDKTHWFKSGDSSRRWMGYHTVMDNSGTREIMDYWTTSSDGNILHIGLEGDDTVAIGTRVVSDATPLATTFTAVGTTAGGTFNPTDLVPESCVALNIKLAQTSRTPSGGAFVGLMHISENSALTKSYAQIVANIGMDLTASGTNFFLAPTIFIPTDPHTWYYACTETTGTSGFLCDIMGAVVLR